MARDYWNERAPGVGRGPRPSQPRLILFAGVPLAGKTTIARRLVEELDVETLHVENDELRPRVAEAMGREAPVFDGDENLATYEAAREVAERGLEEGLHVVHDATNLTETARRRTYALAEGLEVPVRVVFVDAPEEVRERRAREKGPAARRAHEALGDRDPEPEACSRPHVRLDGTEPVEDNVERLLGEPILNPEAQ